MRGYVIHQHPLPESLGCWRNKHRIGGETNWAASDEIGTRSDVSRSVGQLTRGAGGISDYGMGSGPTVGTEGSRRAFDMNSHCSAQMSAASPQRRCIDLQRTESPLHCNQSVDLVSSRDLKG
jgi:hypothetical protein